MPWGDSRKISPVLIVEDEPLIRIGAVKTIEDAGFEVIEAASADEAIRILECRGDIRVVFTDIDMAGSMDGLKLAHAVCNRWPPSGSTRGPTRRCARPARKGEENGQFYTDSPSR
jgi:CheY-like chemotaxis protein